MEYNMSLPKLTTPEFNIDIPSTKEPIRIRPFLVKEEKILYIALESGESKDIEQAITNILESCITTPGINIHKLPAYDIEYLFLQLRGKSVGETITMNIMHQGDNECTHATTVSFDIDEVQVEFNKDHQYTIDIGNGLGIKFKDPSIKDVVNAESADNDYDTIINMIANCVESVYDSDNVYDDFTNDELREFLNSLTQKQFTSVQSFFDTLPKLRKEIEWTCESCGKKDKTTIEGLQNFFM